jgi:hypothetical protein
MHVSTGAYDADFNSLNLSERNAMREKFAGHTTKKWLEKVSIFFKLQALILIQLRDMTRAIPFSLSPGYQCVHVCRCVSILHSRSLIFLAEVISNNLHRRNQEKELDLCIFWNHANNTDNYRL